jgi:hypothetical protein
MAINHRADKAKPPGKEPSAAELDQIGAPQPLIEYLRSPPSPLVDLRLGDAGQPLRPDGADSRTIQLDRAATGVCGKMDFALPARS